MRKRYLTGQDKQDLLFLGGFIDMLDQYIDHLKLGKDNKWPLKMARIIRTIGTRVIDWYIEPLDAAERDKLKDCREKMTVFVSYNNDAIREIRKRQELMEVTILENEDFLQLVKRNFYLCQACQKHGDATNDCVYRKLYIKADVEPLNVDAKFGECPFKVKEDEESVG